MKKILVVALFLPFICFAQSSQSLAHKRTLDFLFFEMAQPRSVGSFIKNTNLPRKQKRLLEKNFSKNELAQPMPRVEIRKKKIVVTEGHKQTTLEFSLKKSEQIVVNGQILKIQGVPFQKWKSQLENILSAKQAQHSPYRFLLPSADAGGGSIAVLGVILLVAINTCLLYTSPSPRDRQKSRMPSSA